MSRADERRRLAGAFDGLATDYARHRPTYPDELIDAATARLATGSRVLEVGCGTGQLTAALVARGLQVHAVDPAPNMIRLAREAIGPSARFEVARFEELGLPPAPFDALFSASAFHWVDPWRSWVKAADALRVGGMLALLQYVGAQDADTADHDDALMGALRRAAPEIAATWPQPRGLDALVAGVDERRDNVSEVWSFVGSYDLAVPDAAALFGDVELTTVARRREQTADELLALFRTTSVFVGLGPERSRVLETETRRAIEGLGGTARWIEVAVLITARRR
jgi:SAM-dependent methyltransferase